MFSNSVEFKIQTNASWYNVVAKTQQLQRENKTI